jgi:hypothetical protein
MCLFKRFSAAPLFQMWVLNTVIAKKHRLHQSMRLNDLHDCVNISFSTAFRPFSAAPPSAHYWNEYCSLLYIRQAPEDHCNCITAVDVNDCRGE